MQTQQHAENGRVVFATLEWIRVISNVKLLIKCAFKTVLRTIKVWTKILK